jgi:hypothetical protein
MKLQIMQLSPVFCYLPLSQNILLSTQFSNALKFCPFLNMTGQVLHKTTGKLQIDLSSTYQTMDRVQNKPKSSVQENYSFAFSL